MRGTLTIPLLALVISSTVCGAPVDIGAKSESAWHDYVGRRVLVKGRFSAYGKFGAIISARKASMYILADPQLPLEPIAEGTLVSVTGILHFQHAIDTDGTVAGVPNYFYFTRGDSIIRKLSP